MTENRKLPPALLAGAGLIDLFAQKMQEYGPKIQSKAQDLPADAQKFANELPGLAAEVRKLAKQVPAELAKLGDKLPAFADSVKDTVGRTDARSLKGTAAGVTESANQTAHAAIVQAGELYQQLVVRGEKLLAERNNKNGAKVADETPSAETPVVETASAAAAEKKTTTAQAKPAAKARKTAAKKASKPVTTKPAAKPRNSKPASDKL